MQDSLSEQFKMASYLITVLLFTIKFSTRLCYKKNSSELLWRRKKNFELQKSVVPASCLRWDLDSRHGGLDTVKTKMWLKSWSRHLMDSIQRSRQDLNVDLDMSGNSKQGENLVSILSRLVLLVSARTLESFFSLGSGELKGCARYLNIS